LATLLLIGCLPLPHTHTTLAAASFTVTDLAGRPLPTAIVHRYAGSRIGGGVSIQDSSRVDTTGTAILSDSTEWHFFMVLLPDGEAGLTTVWCVDAPGYAPVAGRFGSEDAADATLRLRADSAAPPCPARPSKQSAVTRELW
jgi:hypothetical protein